MRRKLLTYTLLAAIAGVVLWACQRDRFGHQDPNAVKPTLTVNEARDFFEYQMSEAMPYLTKLSSDRPTGLMPGDFTPLWDKARIGANREMDGADVPIDPKFIFVAVFDRITPQGDTVRQTVDVIQKLVVKKWRDTSDYKAFSYIASVVPTPEHYAKHKNIGKEFQYAGSKGIFSGFVVYQTLDGVPVAVINYRDGKPTRQDYFPRATKENADSIAEVMSQTIGAATFQGGTPRAFIEDGEILISDEVTVTHQRPGNPWLITIIMRPAELSGEYTPPPFEYNTPNYGGGGAGGGGSIGNTGKPTYFEIKCSDTESKAKSASTQLFTMLGKCVKNPDLNNSVSFTDFTSIVKSRPDVEHSTTLQGYVGSGGIALLPLQHASNSEENITISYTASSIAMVHSHPTAHQTQPSGSDIMALAESLNYSPQMQASYVFVGNDVYCLQVTDPAKAKAFYANNSLKGNDFDPNSAAGRFWKDAQDRMSAMTGFSANERSSAGLAYVLERSDAGIVLSRKGINATRFDAYGVRATRDGGYWPTICQ